MKILDRYSLLCFSVALILMLTIFIGGGGEPEKKGEEIIGIVHDIRPTQNGCTFSLETVIGEKIRCFTKNIPMDLGIYVVSGSYSDDGNMLFVRSIREVHV